MSKAFTREDDESGTALPARSSALVPTERFHLTREGARRLKEHPEAHVRAALDLADVLDPAHPAERALLGVIVHARSAGGETRVIRLVSHAEQLLLGDGCSPSSPLGRALLGAEVGDVREIVTPRGREELEVIELATDVKPGRATVTAAKKTATKTSPAAKASATKTSATKLDAKKHDAKAPAAKKAAPTRSLPEPVAKNAKAAKTVTTSAKTKKKATPATTLAKTKRSTSARRARAAS